MARIISLTGPTLAGKSVLAEELLRRYPNTGFVESLTTRAERPSDLPGEYKYVSDTEFDAVENQRGFLWTAEYGSHRYGTRRQAVLSALQDDDEFIGIMILVPHVLKTLNEFMREHVINGCNRSDSWVACYITPAPPEEVARRLALRGDDPKEFAKRLKAEAGWCEIALSCGKQLQMIYNSGTVEQAADKLDRFMHLHRIA